MEALVLLCTLLILLTVVVCFVALDRQIDDVLEHVQAHHDTIHGHHQAVLEHLKRPVHINPYGPVK